MSDKASAQQDLLKELYNYSATIIPGTETLIAELRHNRQSDTDELFNLVIQGINWEIEVFNNCEDLIIRYSVAPYRNRFSEKIIKIA